MAQEKASALDFSIKTKIIVQGNIIRECHLSSAMVLWVKYDGSFLLLGLPNAGWIT